MRKGKLLGLWHPWLGWLVLAIEALFPSETYDIDAFVTYYRLLRHPALATCFLNVSVAIAELETKKHPLSCDALRVHVTRTLAPPLVLSPPPRPPFLLTAAGGRPLGKAHATPVKAGPRPPSPSRNLGSVGRQLMGA